MGVSFQNNLLIGGVFLEDERPQADYLLRRRSQGPGIVEVSRGDTGESSFPGVGQGFVEQSSDSGENLFHFLGQGGPGVLQFLVEFADHRCHLVRILHTDRL